MSVSSDPNESQATQLLNDLVENGTVSTRMHSERGPTTNSRSTHSNDISSDSFSSSCHPNTIPQYHFHGLASTQTQTQPCEDAEEINEGSQKENIGTRKLTTDTSPPPQQGSPHSKTVQNAASHGDGHSSIMSGQKLKAPMATVTRLQKPTIAKRNSPLKPMSRFIPHRRSDSQDSFACDMDNKPEEQYLARSNKFTVPLSELGKHSSPVRAPSNFTTSSYRKDPSPPSGRILVEETPSRSGSSQPEEAVNLSQQLQATQLVDDTGEVVHSKTDTIVDKDGDTSGYESSEPSSSYRRFLDGKRDAGYQLQATQPSTQVDSSGAEPIPEDAIPWSNLRSAPHPSASSAPHSLLSMVAPENRWRYRQYFQAGSGPGSSVMPSTFGQTSHDRRTPSTFPSSSMGRSSTSAPVISLNMPPRFRPPSPVRPDAMDIVPDSEPNVPVELLRTSKSPTYGSAQFASVDARRQSDTPLTEDSDMDLDLPEVNRAVPPRKEEEEEEEDEDVPLASLPVKKVKNMTSAQSIPAKLDAKRNVPATTAKGKKVTAKRDVNARTLEPLVVPSSVPEQDHSSLHNKKEEKPPSKHKPTPARSRTLRSKPVSSKTRSSKHEPRIVSESEDEPAIQSASRDGTELVEEESDQKPDTRKRKRVSKLDRNTRGAARRAKREASPTPRQSKRLRSALSTSSKIKLEEATRVFALWRQDSHYYPGVVHSTNTDSEYLVRFDDDTECWLKLDQLRLLELRVGDDVLIPNRSRPCRVVNTDGQDDGQVQLSVEEEAKTMQISSLRIASKTILYDWDDRKLTSENVIPIIKPVKPHLSPSPSKLSMLSLPLIRGGAKRILARTGLIVTLTASNGNWEKEKEKVMNAVTCSGGIVVDDLSTILRMDGRHLQNSNTWMIKKTDVEWIGDDEIERLFLVADEPNQKPKFLIALALGIPCLNTDWLHESVNSGMEKEWLSYLLPQGFSNALHARLMQQVDMDWGNSHHHLTKITTNMVPCKLFAQKSILCIGRDMVPQVPQAKGKRKNTGPDEKTQPLNTVPCIILAMGAETVEAVTETHLASTPLGDYDYVVIREPTQYSSEFVRCTTVHWSWVKESLIASRLLPLPVWPSLSVEYSQEA